jgi:hypothetical protein
MREIIFLSTAFRPALTPTEIAGIISPGTKQPQREADHPSPSSAEVKVFELGNCIKLPEQMEYFHIDFWKNEISSLYQEPGTISRK